MVALLLAVAGLSLALFAGRFQETVALTVEAPRSGLVLDPDAKVRVRGVEIGTVASVESIGDTARLELRVDPERLELVPSNATVDIRSTTVFGAKYVNFVVPEDPAPTAMRPGTLLRAAAVTVEFDTLFQRLSRLLAAVDPAKLNATLTAIGQALDGRGAELGALLTRSDAYLAELNPSLPALERDLAATAQVTGLYADTAPDLLRTVDNATVTAATIAERSQGVDAMLLGLIGLSDTGTAVLGENEQALVESLALLRPTAELLYEYKPVLYCLVVGINNAMPLAESLFGGNKPGASFFASFMYGAPAYQYPQDLPKVNATGGPNCSGVLDRVPNSHADYIVTDTNEGPPFVPSTRITPNLPSVFRLLFAGMPGV
ncbi:MCE family protein [Nocardia sp. NPDC057353]|uniref:MCE family protein n=1 Tax=Nocardia sp. NPDC057353 TaxID=3346104 RepID=UPI003630D465